MTNNTNISANICMNGQKLKEVTSFTYLRATISPEAYMRSATAIARLNRTWQRNTSSFASKVQAVPVSC